jgi:hypothetical protein
MMYKFKSKASGDLLMLGPDGDRLLRLLGREPAPRGIFGAADLARSIAALQAAIAAEEAVQSARSSPAAGAAGVAGAARASAAGHGQAAAPGDAEDAAAEPPVGLRQRLWPMIEMMRRCDSAGEPIAWGV